jgi:uncharacterized protein YjbJ (UPF0337 family)
MAIALQNFAARTGTQPVRKREVVMNRDELKGKAEKAKGYVKEEAGEILNDPELEAEGRAERAGGKLREGFGKAKEKVRDAADEILDDDDDL